MGNPPNHFFKEIHELLSAHVVADSPKLPYYEGLPSVKTLSRGFYALRQKEKAS